EEDVAYDVVVQDEDGSRYSSGAFVGVGGNTLTCNMTSAVLREDASKFVVRDPSGQVVVQADLRA
ncbi:MAG: hypothetical protein M3500_15720, partial [Actinomycetota bacterium]|nr:hypothetical protein [Actinomycetota bacterium]